MFINIVILLTVWVITICFDSAFWRILIIPPLGVIEAVTCLLIPLWALSSRKASDTSTEYVDEDDTDTSPTLWSNSVFCFRPMFLLIPVVLIWSLIGNYYLTCHDSSMDALIKSAHDWPQVDGMVISTDIKTRDYTTKKSKFSSILIHHYSFSPIIWYQYHFGDKEYKSAAIDLNGYHTDGTPDDDVSASYYSEYPRALAYCTFFAKGKSVKVYVNPSKPAQSALSLSWRNPPEPWKASTNQNSLK